jgi:hypothetical protein
MKVTDIGVIKTDIGIIAVGCVLGVVFAYGAVREFYKVPKPAPAPIVQIEAEAVTIEETPPVVVAKQTTDEYLCDVYKRTPVKRDGSDFTWKDVAAAKRKGMDVCTYVVGGMAPELKERLLAFGKAADGKGLRWSMLAGFRDDYRQSIASGFKARTGYSQHGGSKVTRGYGDGRAIDITAVGPVGPVLALLDSLGGKLGLTRPMKGSDPNHVQLSRPTRMASAEPQKQRTVKVAKHKTRYAKRFKHKRTRLATNHTQPRRERAFF